MSSTRGAARVARARRCFTAVDDSSLLFKAAAGLSAQQHQGPLLAQADLPQGTAILLPNPRPQITDEAIRAQLFREACGVLAAVAVAIAFVASAIIAFRGRWVLFLTLWLASEGVFWAWFTRHCAELDRQPVPHRPHTNDPILHFKRLVAHSKFFKFTCRRAMDWNAYVSKWFKDTPANHVRLGNLQEMLAYGFFYSTKCSLEARNLWSAVQIMSRQLAELAAPPKSTINGWGDFETHNTCLQPISSADTWTSEVDEGQGCLKIEEGYEPGLPFMAHLWEPLNYHYRPFTFYVIIEFLHWLTWSALIAMGLRHIQVDGTSFYTNVQGSRVTPANPQRAHNEDEPTPIVFIHGVGLGLLPYLLVLARLTAGGVPLLIPEIRHVSMRLCKRVPCASEMASRVVKAMDTLGVQQACVFGHSYGTFIASRLVQGHSSRVHSLAVIDPVCFGMFLPSLLRNFIYRSLWDAFKEGGWKKLLRCLPVWFVSREVHAAYTFCRRFFWTEVNLWPEELPSRSLVVLAGADELLHADEIRQVVSGAYVGIARRPEPLSPDALTNDKNVPHTQMPAQARVLYHPTAGHADWLLDNSWQAELIEQLLSLAKGEDALHQVQRRATAHPASALVPNGLIHPSPPAACPGLSAHPSLSASAFSYPCGDAAGPPTPAAHASPITVKRSHTVSAVIERRSTLSAPPGWPAAGFHAVAAQAAAAEGFFSLVSAPWTPPLAPISPANTDTRSSESSEAEAAARGAEVVGAEGVPMAVEDVASELRQMMDMVTQMGKVSRRSTGLAAV